MGYEKVKNNGMSEVAINNCSLLNHNTSLDLKSTNDFLLFFKAALCKLKGMSVLFMTKIDTYFHQERNVRRGSDGRTPTNTPARRIFLNCSDAFSKVLTRSIDLSTITIVCVTR